MTSSNMNKFLLIFVMIAATISGVSCAKKSSKIRGAKTNARVLNTNTTQDSITLADAQDLNYQLNSVSEPLVNEDGSNTVESEVASRNQFLPFSTTHMGTQDAYGIYDDNIQGTKLDIRSRCIGAECEKYAILITVVKSGYAHHQMAAISFKEDDFFYVEQRNHQRVQLYRSVDELLAQYPNLQAGQ
jgi:hypothetical protein